jgi:SAM-dependent methyltransferase
MDQVHATPELISPHTCPLCGSDRSNWDLDTTTFGSGRYRRVLFSIYRCRSCSIGITDPIPTEETSHVLYESRTSNDFQPNDSAISDRLKRVMADRDVHTFVSGAGVDRPMIRMLDYACGNGVFALSMRNLFPKAKVCAADYHSEAPPMLKDSDIFYSSYGDLRAAEPFDFVLCRHVLEHTYDPSKFLRGLGDLLQSGGILMIEVPNLQAPLRKIFGKYWDGYYVPYHPIHFSTDALRSAIVKAGLIPEKTGGCEMPKIGRSLQNVMDREYNIGLFAAGVLLHPLQFGAKFLTGQSTCLRIWARKP